ncbi:MAG: hypothetical protein K8S55_07595 [Phycisphaerae bacterium]|nr:hypothetical protein [Phycisphaerae bacterium]
MEICFPFLFTFILMACFILFISIKGVLSQRPVFVPAKYFLVLMVIALFPQFVTSANMLFKGISDSMDNLWMVWCFNAIMAACVLVFFWFQMKGYVAIGVSGDSFRDAIHFSLNKNNQPFEEKLSVINLTSINANLQIAIQSWIGFGQIKLKNSKDSKLLPQIVAGINEYYISNNIKPNNITSIFYIVTGVLMLIFSGVLFFVFQQ